MGKRSSSLNRSGDGFCRAEPPAVSLLPPILCDTHRHDWPRCVAKGSIDRLHKASAEAKRSRHADVEMSRKGAKQAHTSRFRYLVSATIRIDRYP